MLLLLLPRNGNLQFVFTFKPLPEMLLGVVVLQKQEVEAQGLRRGIPPSQKGSCRKGERTDVLSTSRSPQQPWHDVKRQSLFPMQNAYTTK